MSEPEKDPIEDVITFVHHAIIRTSRLVRTRKAFKLSDCGIAGVYPGGTIFVFELDGQTLMVNITIEGRKA